MSFTVSPLYRLIATPMLNSTAVITNETAPLLNDTCEDGLLLAGPLRTHRNALIYMAALLWTFLGVAIAADAFMLGIETITSQEQAKTVVVDGRKRVYSLKIWNATVANLTLMALGSSAPEILLSLIEIVSSGFYSGELGPSTIVGSAAFNLFIIAAVCVVAVAAPKKVADTGVFSITAAASVFAYVWLAYILLVSSPNVIEVWEGAATLAFFPLLVWLSHRCGIRVPPPTLSAQLRTMYRRSLADVEPFSDPSRALF